MATVEHCLYCFESLAAHLENREPLSLAEVQKSWAEYVKAVEAEEKEDEAGSTGTDSQPTKLAKRIPALRRLAHSSSSTSSTSNSSIPSAASSTTSLQPGAAVAVAAAETPMTSVSSLAAPTSTAEEGGEEDEEEDEAITESPLFVTWNTLSPRHGASLRGCIGTFEAEPLDEGLSSYALTSALHDTRFSPIARRELPSLEVAVTLLTDFEDAAGGAMDWELGTHGLRISFHYHGRRYGATYLPDVAPEQGWTKEETVVSLMRKAGWMGRRDRWRDVELKVVRYQGRKQSLEYDEYRRWREWLDKKKQGNKK